MKYIANLIYLIVVIVIAGSCSSNKYMSDSNSSVTPLSDKSGVSAGSLVYGLPLTVVDIEIEAERIIEKPWPLFPICRKLAWINRYYKIGK